ncbi:ATP synthase subunit delta, mitochondrial-like [Homarus americanus]|uniref:ATP synthase subunit delta, mitochondrial-like n=1 Tax=Homarus americanus TaxID=6706 RepID=UPI001C473D18|nr:ATP synthase subunit delta, mitochondrial-like [Homarus americanus]
MLLEILLGAFVRKCWMDLVDTSITGMQLDSDNYPVSDPGKDEHHRMNENSSQETHKQRIKLILVIFSQVFYNGANVRQVDVPSFSGSFGILPAHVPSLAVLKPGVMTVFEADGSAKKFFVSSGIVTINEDSSVQILAEEAAGLDELDLGAAREILSKAQSEASSAASEEDKAKALITVEVAEELVKAAESG